MQPVEKMARRILQRHSLKPPYDLDALVSHYGDVEYYPFPVSADGVTIGIGGESNPKILINSSTPNTRQKFTLAHELGHVIIPWHTGTIISHVEYGHELDLDYMQMEKEANLFSAELLLPSSWLLEVLERYESIGSYIKYITDESGTSREAALIKIFNVIESSIVLVEVSDNGEIIKEYKTKDAPSSTNLYGRNIADQNIFATATSEEEFEIGDRKYKAWRFNVELLEENDSRTWRQILAVVLDDTNCQDLQQSVNAILPGRYNRNKDKSEEEIISLALRSYDGREKLKDIILHQLLPQYVVKRIKELIAKNKT